MMTVAAFMGVNMADDKSLKGALERASFAHMASAEHAHHFDDHFVSRVTRLRVRVAGSRHLLSRFATLRDHWRGTRAHAARATPSHVLTRDPFTRAHAARATPSHELTRDPLPAPIHLCSALSLPARHPGRQGK